MKHDSIKVADGSFKGLIVPSRAAGDNKVDQLVISGTNLALYDGVSYNNVLRIVDPLFNFSTHTFTNAAATGRLGPTLAQCQAAYGNAPFMTQFSVSSGIQNFVVPLTARYRLTARGATASVDGSQKTYNPVQVLGTFDLEQGDVLRILVGQAGISNAGWVSGGGGATYVWSDLKQDFLVVAGGCGGCFYATSTAPLTQQASDSTIRQPNPTVVARNATLKAAGRNSQYGGTATRAILVQGGGGASGDNDGPAMLNAVGTPARSFKNGGAGGQGVNQIAGTWSANPGVGGFGGGGGAAYGEAGTGFNNYYSGQGGGGGYTGGDAAAGSNIGDLRAGSGGSYISSLATGPSITNVGNTTVTTHGSLKLDLVA